MKGSDMGDLSRRKGEAVPVQARRTGAAAQPESPPIVIQVPAGQSAPTIPPPASGVTQNIVYIVAPAAAGAPTPPSAIDQPPQEVHYHTTNNYAPIKRRRERGTSFLGLLSIFAGLAACGCAYVPPVADYAGRIGEAGLALGALGLVSAILFRRAGRGVPVIGMMISAIAFPLWLGKTGQLQSEYDQLRTRSPVPLPAIDFSHAPALNPSTDDRSSGVSAPGTILRTPVTPPSAVPRRSGDHSIFGDSAGWQKPDDVAVPGKANASGSLKSQTNSAAAGLPQAGNFSDDPGMSSQTTAQALSNLETVRKAAAQRRGVDYAGAVTAAAAASDAYQQAKIKYDLRSPELVDAHQKELAAASELSNMRSSLGSDPAVAAAELAVRTAQR
jgi:hypothetical protein